MLLRPFLEFRIFIAIENDKHAFKTQKTLLTMW